MRYKGFPESPDFSGGWVLELRGIGKVSGEIMGNFATWILIWMVLVVGYRNSEFPGFQGCVGPRDGFRVRGVFDFRYPVGLRVVCPTTRNFWVFEFCCLQESSGQEGLVFGRVGVQLRYFGCAACANDFGMCCGKLSATKVPGCTGLKGVGWRVWVFFVIFGFSVFALWVWCYTRNFRFRGFRV